MSYDTAESRWQAVQDRDRQADGRFLYGVASTGIYCRPGCASRVPKRGNVAFFEDCAQAEAAGFRPCKRCRPDRLSPDRRRAEAIARACRLLESEDSPKLADLAAEAGLSLWHFQKLFKQSLGVSPAEYAAQHRSARFRQALRDEASVTDAIYAAGYGASSRAHEAARKRLGMTPKAYRGGAEGEIIEFGIAACNLGLVLAGWTARGLCTITLGDEADSLRDGLRQEFPLADLCETSAGDLLAEVVALVEGKASPDLPLDIRGTAFQQLVWAKLRGISPGETLSYAELAARLGQPSATRAVASACAKNRLAIAIPCHRIVRSNGAVSGYRWGVERKRALLAREKKR